MTKSELVARLNNRFPHLSRGDVEKAVQLVLASISEALARGERVELRGFGSFGIRRHDARIGRNPRTGDEVQVVQKNVPFFKAGKKLRERVNRHAVLGK